MQIENASRLYEGATALIVKDKNIREAFLPTGILNRVDQTNPGVQEGMRITFKLLDEMNRICRANNIAFVVAVIPTKESVFAEYLERDKTLPLSDVMDKVIANERIAREKLFQFFNESDIHYVDTLTALTQAAEHELYARTAQDIHPNKNGYKVIAEAIGRRSSKINAVLPEARQRGFRYRHHHTNGAQTGWASSTENR